MRKEFEMTPEELNNLTKACSPVPMIMLQCGNPSPPQENANNAWKTLGREKGFDWETVEPVAGKEKNFFTAEETQTEKPGKITEKTDIGAETQLQYLLSKGVAALCHKEHVQACHMCERTTCCDNTNPLVVRIRNQVAHIRRLEIIIARITKLVNPEVPGGVSKL